MKKEYLIASLIACIVLLCANAPILYFTMAAKTDLTFLGRRVINSQDMYTYLSFTEQSRQGKWMFENLYTTEPQTPSIIRPTYLVIGKFAAVFHLSSLTAYQLARVLAATFFCVILYVFLTELFARSRQRLLAFVLVLTASGLGWLLGRFVNQSSDLWIPESNVFMSLAESPHFILAQALMLSVFWCFLRYLHTKKIRFVLILLLCCGVLAFDHPFDLLTIGPVIFFTGIFAQAPLLPTILISISSTVGVLYPLYELKRNPIFASEQAQGVSYSPSPLSYLSGMGLLAPLSLLGANTFLTDRRPAVKLILLWAVIGVLLLYAPVGFQRRLSEGISIPIGILAAAGLIKVYSALKSYRQRLAVPAIVMIVLLCALSSIMLLKNDFAIIGKDSKESYYYYVSDSEYVGLEWFRVHSNPSDVVLTNWFYGNLLPGVAARRVYVGHKAQTITFDNKVKNINSFLLEKDDEKAKEFLSTNRITYIFVGNNDSMLQYGFKPEEKEYLEMVYDQEGARIYRVLN